jgi:dTDP-glucose 4,6-dehydratase
MRILVTGGAGFIGSNLVNRLLSSRSYDVGIVDCLTYAADTDFFYHVASYKKCSAFKTDVNDYPEIVRIFEEFKPDVIMHLAAESHVDRSISDETPFLLTNIMGTHSLLRASKEYIQKSAPKSFLFFHISTDEVFGELSLNAPPFTEESKYEPSSPYAASKASSDHLVRSWGRTFGIPYKISNCSNNYGPRQFSEKFLPMVILNTLGSKPITIYGDGNQIRDWLYVEDHISALELILHHGVLNSTYLIGGSAPQSNMNITYMVLEKLSKKLGCKMHDLMDLIVHVDDRLGHDFRYDVNPGKIMAELNWKSQYTLSDGLDKTIDWYLDNPSWRVS